MRSSLLLLIAILAATVSAAPAPRHNKKHSSLAAPASRPQKVEALDVPDPSLADFLGDDIANDPAALAGGATGEVTPFSLA
ncbi:hypothetical protein RI367_004647 [Sorochytrium milnesiophthora]